MTLSEQITPHLPYLRRFARSMTGSQDAGDTYVGALLEMLVAERTQFPEAGNIKADLYKLLLQLWGSIRENMIASPGKTSFDQAADRNLQAIVPAARQAFLLTTVEAFSNEEAAAILEVSEGELETLLKRAHQDIAQQVATTVMIIEDEPLIAMDIEEMVERLGHDVVGIARTHKEAVELFNKRKPGIVLADIQLADGSSGLEAVNDILGETTVPVIFITAFPERLLTGTKPEPTYLVNKPFEAQMVSALISQILFFDEQAKAAV